MSSYRFEMPVQAGASRPFATLARQGLRAVACGQRIYIQGTDANSKGITSHTAMKRTRRSRSWDIRLTRRCGAGTENNRKAGSCTGISYRSLCTRRNGRRRQRPTITSMCAESKAAGGTVLYAEAKCHKTRAKTKTGCSGCCSRILRQRRQRGDRKPV